MLSTEIETARMALSELSDSVTPQQWALIRACIQDLGAAADKVRRFEAILLPPQEQRQGGYQHG